MLCILSFLSFAVSGIIGEVRIVGGVEPVVSPDGHDLAFCRSEGEVRKLGVCRAEDGANVRWVEAGPGRAAHPAWTPSGGLVYTWERRTNTAYQAWKAGCANGSVVRQFDHSGKRDLTAGGFRDYTPCVAPDDQTVWFASSRDVGDQRRKWSVPSYSNLFSVDRRVTFPDPVPRAEAPNGCNSGFVQPSVSPDGRFVVWGHLETFLSSCWRIFGARVGELSPATWCAVTPMGMVATAPRWHPRGRIICFTGFRRGDAGWGIWTMNVRTGHLSRFADGENPCFSPDGQWMYYDRDGQVFRKPYGAGDEPEGGPVETGVDIYPSERVVWRTGDGMPQVHATEMAFGDRQVFFVRVTVDVSGSNDVLWLDAEYDHPEVGFRLGLEAGRVFFSAANSSGSFATVKGASPSAGSHVITAIRCQNRLYVAIDGPMAVSDVFRSGCTIPLLHFRRMKTAESVSCGEIGFGWPKNVRRPPCREEVFE